MILLTTYFDKQCKLFSEKTKINNCVNNNNVKSSIKQKSITQYTKPILDEKNKIQYIDIPY